MKITLYLCESSESGMPPNGKRNKEMNALLKWWKNQILEIPKNKNKKTCKSVR
jgi:hypothetical protein